jgi:hypothetical protein
MDPMTMMMLSQFMGGMGGGGQGGGENFGLGALGTAFGGSVLGGHLASKRAKKDKKRQARRLKRAIGATEAIQGNALQQQEALSRLATQQQLGGYDTARKETARLGRGAKRSALDRETQLLGRASQGMANRGLGSTTIGANLQRGIASDTNRSMADVDEGMASLFGNLALGRAGAEAAGTQQLGQIAGQRGDLFSSLAQMQQLGGQTLGNFSMPLSTSQSGFEMALPGMMEGLGKYASRGQQGMDPQMLQWLFGMGPGGYNPSRGQGMNLNSFVQ